MSKADLKKDLEKKLNKIKEPLKTTTIERIILNINKNKDEKEVEKK